MLLKQDRRAGGLEACRRPEGMERSLAKGGGRKEKSRVAVEFGESGGISVQNSRSERTEQKNNGE